MYRFWIISISKCSFLKSLQIKKCAEDDCAYCTLKPPRLSPAIFESLHFLPDPVLKEDGFGTFDELYGTETNDGDRPGLKAHPQSERDKTFKNLLVGGMYQHDHIFYF